MGVEHGNGENAGEAGKIAQLPVEPDAREKEELSPKAMGAKIKVTRLDAP